MRDILEFATPEEVGIPSSAIADFIDDIQERGLMTHSFIVIRHGKVCAECYCPPFKTDEFHRMYSTSKTFASIALGILVDEGKVKLDDKIAAYFPEYCPGNMHEWIADTTVREALMMSTCNAKKGYNVKSKNFISYMFNIEPEHLSGTLFNYYTNATNVVSGIVERITGMPPLEFLKERALLEIGFSPDSYSIEMPQGGSWLGSGVLCSTRDLARFAMLIYNDGYANGKQLLPRDYVIEAKSKQIDNNLSGNMDKLHGHGYGYQIWRIFENGYAFLGMGGQYALTFPDYDLIFCCTGDIQGAYTAYAQTEPFWYNVMKKIKKFDKTDYLPAAPEAKAMLDEKIKNFKAPLPMLGQKSSPMAEAVNGVVYKVNKNPMDIGTFSLTFNENGGVLHLGTLRGNKDIPFGMGEYVISQWPETHYSGTRIGVPAGRGYRSMSAALWTEEHKIGIRSYLIDDYFGNLYTVISFKGNKATLNMSKSAEGFLEEYDGVAVGTRL